MDIHQAEQARQAQIRSHVGDEPEVQRVQHPDVRELLHLAAQLQGFWDYRHIAALAWTQVGDCPAHSAGHRQVLDFVELVVADQRAHLYYIQKSCEIKLSGNGYEARSIVGNC